MPEDSGGARPPRPAQAREAYLPHPAHKALVDVLKPHLDKVLVIDCDAKP
jgi:hypothetical protein